MFSQNEEMSLNGVGSDLWFTLSSAAWKYKLLTMQGQLNLESYSV